MYLVDGIRMENLTIGKKIKLLRELKGFKQDYIAEQLGMTQNGYGKIERDETDIPYSRLESIAKVFEVSVSDLINLNQQKIHYSITNNNSQIENVISKVEHLYNSEHQRIETRLTKLEQELLKVQNILNNVITNK
jgi:transcriptional regulator with XRE-family HTH domain